MTTDASCWTADAVEVALRAALVTLRRVPAKGLWPGGLRSSMPEIVRTYAEAYGYDETRRPRVLATADDIRNMDRALGWLASLLSADQARAGGLPGDTSHIVWLRVSGATWERIIQWRLEFYASRPAPQGGRQMIERGNSIPSVRAAYRGGIALIVDALNSSGSAEQDAAAAAETADVARAPRAEYGVQVEVARQGESLGEGSYGPIHASARWTMVRKARR